MTTGPEKLVDVLLAKPVGASVPPRKADPDSYTSRVEVSRQSATVELRGPTDEVSPSAAMLHLVSKGEAQEDWEPTGFRSSEWTMANGEQGVSTRYTYKRTVAAESTDSIPLDELLATIEPFHLPSAPTFYGDYGYMLLLGDMQFGKVDGDGVAGTLARTIGAINRAADLMAVYDELYGIGVVHIAWLGDHIEGFVSQGGANVWRTPLTLNEQIRLTRRVMMHALVTFAPLTQRLSMVAVPGNHGEAQRFSGKGVTRYDDSHDTESLIAVSEAAGLAPEKFGHCEFFVPDTDEMTVVTNVAGTIIGHAHGHQWRPTKHFDWWRGQAFHAPALAEADLLVAGHLHHFHVDTDGPRTFIQTPAMESESTWYRHSTGTVGAPGAVVAITKDGRTTPLELI